MTTVPGTYFTKEQLEADIKGNDYFLFFYTLILNELMNLFIKLMMYRVKITLVVMDWIGLYGYIKMRRNSTTKHWGGIF
jgi:hypothetical protein